MNFQKCYQRLLAAAGAFDEVLATVRERSAVINYEHRITGNGVIDAVTKLLGMKDDVGGSQIQRTIDRLIASQVLIPAAWHPIAAAELEADSRHARLLRAMHGELEACKETV